jgi:Na+/H+ antiporter NhaD/arsenite permease-like protein
MSSEVLVIFVLTYLGLAFGKVPGLRMDRAAIAFLGATVMLIVGAMTVSEAMGPDSMDYETLLLLFGMMVVVGFLRLSGAFVRLAHWALDRIKTPRALLAVTILLSGILSAVLVNDVVCLAITPLLLHMTTRLRFDPLPQLLGIATAANIGSTATITGNPQNMIIGTASHIPYLHFAAHLLPIALMGLAVDFVIICIVCRKRLTGTSSNESTVKQDKIPSRPLHRWLQTKATIITLLAIALFCFHIPMALTAMGAAAVLLAGRIKSSKILRQVDWNLLLMFGGLFIVVHAFQIQVMNHWDVQHWSWLQGHSITLITVASAILSNVVSNVPAVLLFKPVMQAIPHAAQEAAWLALSASSTLAGNFTILGSVANLIVVEKARQEGVTISFWEYLKVGVPVTLLTLGIAVAWLSFVHY